jgi:hypothetical protein
LSTTNPATSNPIGAPDDPDQAVYRRLVRALGDLTIDPRPVGDEPQCWATLDVRDGVSVVAFGALSISTAARLVGEYVMAPFEPVASPLEPYHTTSRHHPRTGW